MKKDFCSGCARTAYCTRQYDEDQRNRCPILNGDDEPLCYRNSEGYSDPTAYFALRNVMKKPKMEKESHVKKEKKRHPRTQVVHYD